MFVSRNYEQSRVPSSRHSRALLLVADGKSDIEVNFLYDLDQASEESVHLDHCFTSASLRLQGYVYVCVNSH